jgi:hypothetical protein
MIDLSFSLVGQIIITIICKVYLKLWNQNNGLRKAMNLGDTGRI